MTEIVKRESPTVLAQQFAASGLFPDLQSEAQAYVKVVAGQELGLGPLASVSGLNVIKGRVTFSANLLASMVKRHPRYDYRVADHNERGCRIVFTEAGEEIGVSTFTMDDAQRARLGGTNWEKYPKAMLFARALTQGVRWFCPDVTAGAAAYSPEEIADGEVVEEVQISQSEKSDLLEELAAEVHDYDFDEEQKDAIREYVRSGGDEAARTALEMLREGNPGALFAGISFESEAAA